MAQLGGQFQLGGPLTAPRATWKTVAEIVSDVAIEEGLAAAPIVDPFASDDPNILQLVGLLKGAGRGIVRERGWSHLQRELVFQTEIGTASYALPTDFREMVEQSGWDRTTAYRLGGPIGANEWQYAQAITVAGNLSPSIRFEGGTVSLSPTPAAVETIAFEYRSWSWVMPVGETAPTVDAPTAATDIVCFNSALMVCALKLAWEKAKRMDTTTAQADYDRALASEMNADAGAPEIKLGESGGPAPGWGNAPLRNVGR